MSDRWVSCPDWPDYEVSSEGAVRRVVTRHSAHPGVRKPYVTSTGYQYIVMRSLRSKMAVGVHRLVATGFLGPAPFPDAQVAHLDGNRLNNRLENLRWVTRSENERHKVGHGKSNRGERQGRSVLSQEKVRCIRVALGRGARQRDLAVAFGVSRTTISSISIGKSWAHVV